MKPEDFKYYKQLFEEYISVCNKIIALNKSKFPYSHIFKNDGFYNKNLTVKIIDDSPKLEFAVAIKNDNLVIDNQNLSHENKVLLLKKNQLEDIIKNQQNYITNPEKINWNLISEFI